MVIAMRNTKLWKWLHRARYGYGMVMSFFDRCATRFKFHGKTTALIRQTGSLKLHLGCGDQNIDGFLNCDFRSTKATDVAMDCSNLGRFRARSVSLVFAHAFLEHLYRNTHLSFIRDCCRILKEGAPLVLLGTPDFKVIADCYLKKSPGIKGPVFDLYHVYRYTHGDPEVAGPSYWLQQLHKSLFDEEYLSFLLRQGGFGHVFFFNYCYPGETLPLNLGLVAWAGDADLVELGSVLKPFEKYFACLDKAIESAIYVRLPIEGEIGASVCQ